MNATRPERAADSRDPVEEGSWDDSLDPVDGLEAPDPRGRALGRLLAFAGLMALAAVGVGASLGDRRAKNEMPHRFCSHETAWRLATLDPAGNRLFGADALGMLDRLDLRSGRIEHWGKRGPAIQALAVDPTGGTLAIGGLDGSVILRNTATGAVRLHVAPVGRADGTTDPSIKSLAYHPDGRTLVAGLANGMVRFLNATDGRTLHEAASHDGAVTHLVFDPSGQYLISATANGTVRLGDGVTGQTERTIWKAHVQIRHIALSPDGRTLALSLAPERDHLLGQVLVADLAEPDAPIRTLADSYQDTLAFTPDGRSLVAAGFDSTVRQWDIAASQLVAIGLGHRGFINRVLITPDGRQAITSGEDRQLGVFDLRSTDVSS